MSLISTRFGGNAPGLPAASPLPSISAALSRRAALFGAVTVASVTAAAAMPATGHAAILSANDARLVALADEYEALDRRCKQHSATHRGLSGNALKAAEAEFDQLVDGFGPIEDEIAETPADGHAGLMAKARALQVPVLRDADEAGVGRSLADDMMRLFGKGALS